MLPVLSHIEDHHDLSFWVTTDGICGVGFQITPCDIETENADDFGLRLVQALRQLDAGIVGRIKMEATACEDLETDYPRRAAMNSLGFTRKKFFLYLDCVGGFHALKEFKKIITRENESDQAGFKALLQVKSVFEQFNFKLRPLGESEVAKLFDRGNSAWIRSERSIETGEQSIGVVRMLKQPLEEFTVSDWVETLDKLPKPVQVTISFQRLGEARAKLLLERKLKQTSSGTDISSKTHSSVTENLILKNFQSGTQFFEMEVLFVFERRGQEELSKTLSEAVSNISMFSDAMIETFGVAPSYVATLPGSHQHVTLLETDQALAALLPICVRGESVPENIQKIRVLTLQREDQSLYHFDLFNSNYNVFNTLIVGTSGKGKSVLTGLLTSSLLNDPNVTVIKLDVGGSHSKECELFNGEEYQLSLDKPSGINPFEVLNIAAASDNDKIGILSKFLASLIQEQGELVLSKSLRSELENSVREYIDTNSSVPCLDNFYNFATSFPRKELLRRWVNGGLYEKAFASPAKRQEPTGLGLDSAMAKRKATAGSELDNAPTKSRAAAGSELDNAPGNSRSSGTDMRHAPEAKSQSDGPGLNSRLRYYNFSQIFQAADPEFAQAGIAAVLSQFNMEMLRANGRRLVLVCDETPFFIKSCFDFFKFSTANVRKYGHAVVLISQLSTDFVVAGDTGIIENSPQRFLFSLDGDERQFGERFNLAREQIVKIKGLKSLAGSFSEVLLQTGETAKKLKVKVTPEEYWRLTTSKGDKEKLQTLLDAVPGLTMKQAIAALATAPAEAPSAQRRAEA